jgi:hypothetical protein
MIINGENKSKLNLSIDIIMFMLLIPVAGIGFLMKYVIVSGKERNIIYGNNVDLEFLGLTRHQWGTIHLTLSIIFLVLLILHIILHWKIIICLFSRLIPAVSIRFGIALFLALFCLIILISPFFIVPEKVPFQPQYRNRSSNSPSLINHKPEAGKNITLPVQKSGEPDKTVISTEVQESQAVITEPDHHDSDYKEYEVYGYQTLRSVSDKYNIPASYLANSLKIPENLTGQKLGFLRKQYSFTMTDVRKSISDYKKK